MSIVRTSLGFIDRNHGSREDNASAEKVATIDGSRRG